MVGNTICSVVVFFARPLSAQTPTIILDRTTRDVRMVIGAAGGPKITTITALVRAHHHK